MESVSNSQYSDDYLKWKNWENKSFGELSSIKKAYFSALLSKCNRSFTEATVLEIGFGDGDFLTYAKQNGWNVSGLEMSEELLAIAANKGFEVNRADHIGKLEKNRYDMIVAFDVLEHIPQHELANFLNSVKAGLKEGGVFVAKFPNGDSPLGLPCQNGDITHLTTIGSGKVVYFAEVCGFELVHLAGESKPILCQSITTTARRMLSVPIKACLELCIRIILNPKTKAKSAFLSENLEVILKKLS